jgi:hypothetical protein
MISSLLVGSRGVLYSTPLIAMVAVERLGVLFSTVTTIEGFLTSG